MRGGLMVLGVLSWGQERWGRVRLSRERVLELAVLRASLAPGGRREGRRLDRAGRLLLRQGVRLLLPLRRSPPPVEVERLGLSWVEPTPLYRFLAAPLVLATLEREGRSPRRSAVALRGRRVDQDLERTARLLCPVVRELVIDAPAGGEALARALYWEYGIAVRPDGGADVSVRFGGEPAEKGLLLCGPAPDLGGVSVTAPEIAVPEELESLPVLSALWQAGRLREKDFRLSYL